MTSQETLELQREPLWLVAVRVREACVRKPRYGDGALGPDSVCRELSVRSPGWPRRALMWVWTLMPRLMGSEVYPAPRAEETPHDTLVPIRVAKGRDTEVARGLDLAAVACMAEPVSTREPVQKVREMLSGATGPAAA